MRLATGVYSNRIRTSGYDKNPDNIYYIRRHKYIGYRHSIPCKSDQRNIRRTSSLYQLFMSLTDKS